VSELAAFVAGVLAATLVAKLKRLRRNRRAAERWRASAAARPLR